MGVLSADQVRTFVAVADSGSFSAAGKMLRRTQSAVSYAVANLEQQMGVELFDRTGLRPCLTQAGVALLGDARRAVSSLDVLLDRGHMLARGVEAEIFIVADVFCPPATIADLLVDFAREFPAVRPKIQVALVHHALSLVTGGEATLGLIAHPMGSRESLHQAPLQVDVSVRPYVGSRHSLAHSGRLENSELRDHVQFVLGDISGLSTGQDLAIFTERIWQVSDFTTQRELMRAGIGWGFLPEHLAADDLAACTLMPLQLAAWPDGGAAHFPMMAVRRADSRLGPAATWLLHRLTDGVHG